MSQSITAEELKQIKNQQTELGQVLNQIGQLEANKHALLHKIAGINEDIETTKKQLEEKEIILGEGNGNGIPEPGERIAIYYNGRPTRLYYQDEQIVDQEEELFDEMLPAIWPDGFTLSSIVKISDECPKNYKIKFLTYLL